MSLEGEDCMGPTGHHWTDYESQTNPQSGGWYLTLRCVKCGKVARQIIDGDGVILTPRRYTPSFASKRLPKLSRSEWRRRYLLSLGENE